MQLYAQDMELRCIATLGSNAIPERIRSTLLGKLSKDFFHYPPCATAFQRIDVLAKRRFEIVDLADLIEDPALDEDYRDILRDMDVRPCKNKKQIDRMLDRLDEYRKIRIVYDLASGALDSIEDDKLDVDALLDKITDSITKARRDIEDEDQFVHMGDGDNSDELVHDVLHSTVEELIHTGYTAYDSRNGGLPIEGVMLLASTTSGGKSTMLMNLLINLYLQSNRKVCRVSFEMGDKQEMSRFLCRVSGVPFWKFKQKKLSPKEKQRVQQAHKEFNQHGKKNKCRFSTVTPRRSMRFDDVMRMVKPFGYDVIGIDYVNLLDGVDGDDQWRKLDKVIKQAKGASRQLKCLIIVLAQLNDESDGLKFAKSMKDHVDVMWKWNYAKKEQRELRVLPIHVDKARDGEIFSFDLGERYDIMKVENLADGGAYGDDDDDDESDGLSDSDLNEEREDVSEEEDDYVLT